MSTNKFAEQLDGLITYIFILQDSIERSDLPEAQAQEVRSMLLEFERKVDSMVENLLKDDQ